MSGRWSIFVDLEGFSELWNRGEDQILWSLSELMHSIFLIGGHCFPDSPERLFAHQLGDGFVIVSEFHEYSLDRCTTIAIAIMRHVAATGRLARGAIAEGSFSDIQGCYPKEILKSLKDDAYSTAWWPSSRGMGGHHAVESMATMPWNTQMTIRCHYTGDA